MHIVYSLSVSLEAGIRAQIIHLLTIVESETIMSKGITYVIEKLVKEYPELADEM